MMDKSLNGLFSAYQNKNNWSKNRTDVNGDGKINYKDRNYLNNVYKELSQDELCFDINGDGEFDYRDLFSFSTKMDIDGDGEVSKDEETFLKSIKSTLSSKLNKKMTKNDELSIDDLLAFEEDLSKIDSVTAKELKFQISSLEKTLINKLSSNLEASNYDLTNGNSDKTSSEVYEELKSKLSELGVNSKVVQDFMNTLQSKVAIPSKQIDASMFPAGAEITMLNNGGYTVRFKESSNNSSPNKSNTNTEIILTYDANNKLMSKVQGSTRISYSYDVNGHLLSAVKTNKNGQVTQTWAYTCDNRGNVISARTNNSVYTYRYDENNNVIYAKEENARSGRIGQGKQTTQQAGIDSFLKSAELTYINPVK